MKPKSSVRRKGPSPVSDRKALNVRSVSSGQFQYPPATLGPKTQISPTRPDSSSVKDSGSTMATRSPGNTPPQPTSSFDFVSTPEVSAAPFFSSAAAPILLITGGLSLRPPVTIKVASANP